MTQPRGLDNDNSNAEVTQVALASHIQLLNNSSLPCKSVSKRVIELTIDFTESLTCNNSSVVWAVFKAA